METFLIISVVVILIVVLLGSTGKKETRKKSSISLEDAQKLLNKNKYGLEYYDSTKVKVLVKQALETVHILENSINVKTIEERYDFLNDVLEELSYYKQGKIYYNDMQSALNTYENNYYNRITSKEQKAAIEMYDYDSAKFLFKTALIRAAVECYHINSKEILSLKQQTAINKRKDLIIGTLEEIKEKIIFSLSVSELIDIPNLFNQIADYVNSDNFEEKINIHFEKEVL